MRKVTFTFCTEDVVIHERRASIQVPDEVSDVEVYIEENINKWSDDEIVDVLKTRGMGEPMDIEVENAD